MKTTDKKNSHSFYCLCNNCGFRFYTNKLSRRNQIFPSTVKIEGHQIIPKKLKLFCPECKSQDIAIDFGEINSSPNTKSGQEPFIDSNPANGFAEQISVSLIEKTIGIFSYVTKKITKADKVKNNCQEHSEKI